MFRIRSGMREIEGLMEHGARGGLDFETGEFFRLAGDIRSFAVHELGLSNTENYTHYVETERDHIVDVVSAVRSDSLERYERTYPIVGRVFYRGYFRRAGAEDFASRLRSRGYDVIIREVDAYSSLGMLADPLYSYMKSYSDYGLAEMIIHEMVHATVWIPGRNEFNEEIATFIGREAAFEFIRRRRDADPARLQQIRNTRRDFERLLEMFRRIYRELEREYAGHPLPEGRDARLKIKERVIGRAKERFTEDYDAMFHTERYARLAETEWNHALIDLYMQYASDLSLYYRLLQLNGGNLRETVHTILDLEDEGDPEKALRRIIDSAE
jgi:predicted aminopeptidase